MKVLIDMNLSPQWIDVFTEEQIESIHWSTIGDPAATDREIMIYAQTNKYILFTNDLDFGALLAVTQSKLPSVIQLRNQDLLPSRIGNTVISIFRQFQSQLEAGALITVDSSRSRVRILPIISG